MNAISLFIVKRNSISTIQVILEFWTTRINYNSYNLPLSYKEGPRVKFKQVKKMTLHVTQNLSTNFMKYKSLIC